MIHVLLLILKIIGIALLVILGLILLILALVLFVPVFYKVHVVHNPEKTEVKGRVSFLFPLLLATVQYLKKLSYKIRVFGFAVLDSEKPKKEKPPKKKKPKKAKKAKKKKTGQNQEEKEQSPEQEPDKPELPETVAEIAKPEENAQAEHPAAAEPVTENAAEQAEAEPETKEEAPPPKPGFFEKLSLKLKKIRETIGNIVEKIKKLLHQKDEVQRILSKPETKRALSFAWDKLKHLLKHILPRKIKGYVAYGADDPATTGQVLAVLGVVYAKTGQLVEIRPNFEEKQLECDVELKGHIQLFTLLVIVIKVVLNEEIRQLIAEFKKVKEIE